jgi:hypothetical protein
VAICLGPYSIGNAIPSPFSELGGNCIVTAINLPCGKKKSQAELDNPDETYDLRINELSNGGTCSKTIKGTISIEKGYASSPFEMITINPNSKDSYGPYIPSGEGLF